MFRSLMFAAILIAPTLMCAQVFPALDPAEIRKAADLARTPEPEKPIVEEPRDPDPAPTKTDPACYNKYVELRTKFLRQQGTEEREINKTLVGFPLDLQVYCRGIGLFRLGFYTQAKKYFTSLNRERADGDYNPLQQRLIDQINQGDPYTFRMYCEVLEEFDDFADLDALDKAWNKATIEAQKVIKDVERAAGQGYIAATAAQTQKNIMTSWLASEKQRWTDVFNARKVCKEAPDDLKKWEALIKLVGPDKDGANDTVPCYVEARAILLACKEHLADNERVKSGIVEAGLVQTYFWAWQVNKALDACETKSSMDYGTRLLLLAARDRIEKFRDEYCDDLRQPVTYKQ